MGERPRVLVLGSMPGVRSLSAGEYYAHPRNAFWLIMGALLGFEPELPYRNRLTALKAAGIGLWDVLHCCVRPGSADSAIQSGSRVANDFPALFRRYPGIELVCFNGAEAERSFRRSVQPLLIRPRFNTHRLPSTSPAYAALSVQGKQAAWAKVILPRLTMDAWRQDSGRYG
ncbi:DNA-deoxyinosine glycosylase [Methylonatrum kenyense]|nr:DNA-deoxyinosine glycosylase [Methylonatrum kenyense]